MNTKHTKGEHYAVNYAGYVTMQSTPNYDDNPIDLLNEESCPQAEANGKLYAAAPEMLKALYEAKAIIYNIKNGKEGRSEIELQIYFDEIIQKATL